ncbi:MAG TPA: hypothetical protein PLZ36_17270 [Armatimonadota bacterium]|nr:hypothetical protein [Armatimonadota bacterium]HOS43984.1 hypothetical protein [Armatimonadota bacterium]
MTDRFAKAMMEGKEYAADHEFAEARAAFQEALRYKRDAPDAHYYFAFAASEEIGAHFLVALTKAGISLGHLHMNWQDALHPDNHAKAIERVTTVYGKRKIFRYKLAAANARRRLASCVKHLHMAVTMRPHYTFARELLEKLEPLADASPLSLVAAVLS